MRWRRITVMSINSIAQDNACCNPSLDSLNLYLREAFRRIHNLTKNKGYGWATNAAIGKLLNKSAATAERYLRYFRQHGFIHTEYDPLTQERRIFCLVCACPKSQKCACRNSAALVRFEGGGSSNSQSENAVSIPYKQIPEENNQQHTATPQPEPTPSPAVVVLSEPVSSPNAATPEDQQKPRRADTNPDCSEWLDKMLGVEAATCLESNPTPQPTTRKQPPTIPPADATRPAQPRQPVTPSPTPLTPEQQATADALIAAGIHAPAARSLVQRYGVSACQVQLRHYDSSKHTPGWLVRAIETGYVWTEKKPERPNTWHRPFTSPKPVPSKMPASDTTPPVQPGLSPKALIQRAWEEAKQKRARGAG